MTTLVCLQQNPLYITNLPPSPWNPKTTYLPKRITIWKINAKAKGFSKAQANSPDQKSIRKETITIGKGKDPEGDDKIPDVVMERMVVRILLNVGVPLATGIALLQAFGAIKEQNLWDVPRWLPFLTTLLTFGASALGIAYGTLSASWDPEKKGSILGFQEARENWVEMWKEEDEFNR
ncbi:hypothetical protein LguiA_024123 [Lonicera macranthoides]